MTAVAEKLVAKALIAAGAVFFVPDAPVTFASGIRSPVYMDTRRLLASPELWSGVIEVLAEAACGTSRVESGDGADKSTAEEAGARSWAADEAVTADETEAKAEVVAGVAVGGIPHSTAVALRAGLPSCFVRKQAKEHGRGKAIEGADVEGRRVVLVEDVITTGGSSLDAVASLQAAGADVNKCVAIAGYDLDGASEKFTEADVSLRLLAPFHAVLEAAEASGNFQQEAIDEARLWHQDPHGWS